MVRLRLLIAPLALLLAFVVGGQTTDLLPCADGGCGLWHLISGGHADDGDGDGGQDAAPDCLCRSTYTSTARAALLEAAVARHAFRQDGPPLKPPTAEPVPTPPPQS